MQLSGTRYFLQNSYLYHQKLGNAFACEKNYNEALIHYNNAFTLNPFNLLLISQIADVIVKNPDAICLFPLLPNALRKALKKRGERHSVYEVAPSVSYVSQKIMHAHHAIQSVLHSGLSGGTDVSSPLRLVLLTCVWRRPALTEVVLSYYQEIAKQLTGQIDLVLLAVGSEGRASRQLCERYGFHYLEHKNLPLSDKWEFGLKNSRQFGPDGVITAGSDDLLSLSLFQRYVEFLKEGYLFCGLRDGYFLDLANSEKMLYWKGYGGLNRECGMPWRLNETLGMGRMYSRLLLEQIDYSLWDGKHINKGLDGVAKERLFSLGMLAVLKEHAVPISVGDQEFLFGQVAMRMNELGAFALDIKSPGENVTDMNGYRKSEEACEIIDDAWSCLKKHFPQNTLDSLKALSIK